MNVEEDRFTVARMGFYCSCMCRFGVTNSPVKALKLQTCLSFFSNVSHQSAAWHKLLTNVEQNNAVLHEDAGQLEARSV